MSDGSPETRATKWLKDHAIAFTTHSYDYEEQGGTKVSSAKLGVDEHTVVKTLVMEDEAKKPLIVLMHGDKKVSTKALARQIGRKRIDPCQKDVAERHTGYQVGGTSPFGTEKEMPVFVEKTILELPRIFINGGRRGYLVLIESAVLVDVLKAVAVEVAS